MTSKQAERNRNEYVPVKRRATRVLLSLALTAASSLIIGSTGSCPPPNHPSAWGVNGSYFPSRPDGNHLQTAYDGGFRWLRLYIPWAEVQPTSRTTWNWSALDQAITLASSKGFSILASFRDVPTWANQGVIPNDTACGGHGFLEEVDIPHDTPTGAADFQTFVAAVVNRYGGFVRAWELWNEPDLCGFWRGSAEQWRRLVLIPGYQGIVGTGLPATIVAPGISGVGGGIKNHLDDFLTRYDAVSNTQVLEVPIDVYSFHRYASPADVKTSLENADEYFRCTADGAHCTDVYWLTEFGYDNQSQNCGVCWWGNPSDAGNAAVEVYDHCYNHTRFCFKAFYWDLISSSDPPQVDCNCDTSLLNFSDGTPRGRFDTISDYLLVHPSP